ncbi:hypothetical protein CesoFtcFv8_025454 [Champsocephalus esox]|uniref:Uncharacterized protein n=1 Tax=Champsocephalus esox TaxID=159716 RepID=A0AAN8GF34_9TELE|nr:hypothetical protein CesoFtcFv8_025454 [Champsocephalus esox]
MECFVIFGFLTFLLTTNRADALDFPDVEYNCTVSTGRNKMAATLFKQTSLSGSSAETTMPCTSSKSSPTGLIWRFNHSQIIIEHSQASARSGGEIAGIVVGVVGVVALSVAAGLVVLFKQRRTKKGRRESHGNDCELKPFNSQLKTSDGSNGGLTEDDPLKVISSQVI